MKPKNWSVDFKEMVVSSSCGWSFRASLNEAAKSGVDLAWLDSPLKEGRESWDVVAMVKTEARTAFLFHRAAQEMRDYDAQVKRMTQPLEIKQQKSRDLGLDPRPYVKRKDEYALKYPRSNGGYSKAKAKKVLAVIANGDSLDDLKLISQEHLQLWIDRDYNGFAALYRKASEDGLNKLTGGVE